jgi:hypothetical protein
MSVIIIKDFLDKNICDQLNNWVDWGVKNKWLDKGMAGDSNWNYSGRFTTRNYGNRFDYPKVVYDVYEKITYFLKLNDLNKSVSGGGKNGVVVSCTFPNGDVYAHKDPKEGDLEVLRCNILTRNANDGGKLYVDNKFIDINVGDLHCYLPSTIEHYVTKVEGSQSRVLWMFGYQCSFQRFNDLINQSTANLPVTFPPQPDEVWAYTNA